MAIDTLPDVPGGWTIDAIDIGDRVIDLARPQSPDRFLDEPAVLAANRRDDYMPYWSYLWPAAVPMARTLAHFPLPRGEEVLEIGSGVGLVGVAALCRGWRVTFSDYNPSSLDACRRNAERNGFPEVPALLLDWRNPPTRTFRGILGCEVIYEARSHRPILDLLSHMLAPDGVCWIADPRRSQAPEFVSLAQERGFLLTVRDVSGAEVPYPSDLPVHIFEIRRGTE